MKKKRKSVYVKPEVEIMATEVECALPVAEYPIDQSVKSEDAGFKILSD